MGVKGIKFLPQFDKPLKLFILSNFMVYFVAMGISNVLQGIYLKSMGFDEIFLGNVIAAKTVASGASAILAGYLADKLGQRNTLMLGSVLSGMGYLGQSLFLAPWAILFFAVLCGVGVSLMYVNESPFIAEHSQEKNRVNAFSLNFVMITAAGVCGSLVAGKLPDIFGSTDGIRLAMLAFSICAFASIVPLSFLKNKRSQKNKASGLSYSELLKNKKIQMVILYNALIGFGGGLVVPFFNVFLEYKLSAGTDMVGNIMGTAQIATVMGGLIVPILSKRLGRIKTVALCQLGSIPFLISISFSHTVFITTIGFFFRNALMNMATPVINSMTMELIGSNERATLSGLMTLTMYVSRGLSAVVAGWMMYNLSYEFPYYITAFLYTLATIVFFKIFNNKKSFVG